MGSDRYTGGCIGFHRNSVQKLFFILLLIQLKSAMELIMWVIKSYELCGITLLLATPLNCYYEAGREFFFNLQLTS